VASLVDDTATIWRIGDAGSFLLLITGHIKNTIALGKSPPRGNFASARGNFASDSTRTAFCYVCGKLSDRHSYPECMDRLRYASEFAKRLSTMQPQLP